MVRHSRPGFLPGPFLWVKKNIVFYLVFNNIVLSLIYQITIKKHVMKKITLATLKSFVKKNSNNLFINVKSSFCGYTDCVQSIYSDFAKAEIKENVNVRHNMGIDGAWLVGSSRDYMSHFENEKFVGIEVYNSCGKFIIAIAK